MSFNSQAFVAFLAEKLSFWSKVGGVTPQGPSQLLPCFPQHQFGFLVSNVKPEAHISWLYLFCELP